MELMRILWSLWGLFTAAFIVLLIYRGTLGMHEDDQLFLDHAESQMAQEQSELQRRMARLRPITGLAGGGSVILILAIAVLWCWRIWHAM